VYGCLSSNLRATFGRPLARPTNLPASSRTRCLDFVADTSETLACAAFAFATVAMAWALGSSSAARRSMPWAMIRLIANAFPNARSPWSRLRHRSAYRQCTSSARPRRHAELSPGRRCAATGDCGGPSTTLLHRLNESGSPSGRGLHTEPTIGLEPMTC
jgi:hypothetical protein